MKFNNKIIILNKSARLANSVETNVFKSETLAN